MLCCAAVLTRTVALALVGCVCVRRDAASSQAASSALLRSQAAAALAGGGNLLAASSAKPFGGGGSGSGSGAAGGGGVVADSSLAQSKAPRGQRPARAARPGQRVSSSHKKTVLTPEGMPMLAHERTSNVVFLSFPC